MFPTSSLFPTSFIGMHTLISKTYRPEEEILKYDDVAELAQERLPDRFVSEALGLGTLLIQKEYIFFISNFFIIFY